MDSRIARICQNKNPISIGTHDGKFHTDELIAITLIRKVIPGDVNITRTRDPKLLDSCDLVVDVGHKNFGKYFDHHGRDFQETHPETRFRLAATGIVWYDLRELILDSLGPFPTKEAREDAANLIFKRLILPTDADDNGQFAARPSGPQPVTLPEIVNSFNAAASLSGNPQDSFLKCLEFVQTVIYLKMAEITRQVSENARILEEMLNAPSEDRADGIFVLQQQGPWISAVLNNWEDTLCFKVCIFPGDSPNKWKIQTFPGSRCDRKAMRCPAPSWMRGHQRDLSNSLTENIDVIFVHADGFIGSVEGTLDQAKAFARLWISQSSN